MDRDTASFIFEETLMKALRHKTILIITHSLEHLKYSDYIFVMQDGRILKEGDYEEVQDTITNKEFGLVNPVKNPGIIS